MDGVELTRQQATGLHEALVAKGHDPWAPYAFAVAEAKRREIDVEPTAAGAAVLNGGRATYIAADALILHENSGSAFEQAFLIAHEIGHVELGDDPDDGTLSIDLCRPAEPSPIGMDRVVDYGRRQRREIQMDLFAREFLLPRSVVRRLHVDENFTASEIAKKLGAPFEVVAQQLFDALLLPPIPASSPELHVEKPLNERQSAAVDHLGEAFLLEAGPGTGKTQTLIARVESLLSAGVDPRRILLLTFSNKAAAEMAERIARKRPDAAVAMWIGTFHAFGLDIIRRFHAELGLPKDPRMMDRTEAVELLEDEFPRLKLHHYRNLYDPAQVISDLLNAVSRAKDEVVDAKDYQALADAMLSKAGDNTEARESAERTAEVARVYEEYEQIKRRAHCVDFGDLVALPVKLLESNSAIRASLQSAYDHVLVDEYQDVNRSSVRLLTALRPDGRNLWVVGDGKQSVYRFRGASSFNMSRFGREDFPSGVRGRLKLNYRSASEIVAGFSRFAVSMKAGDAASALDPNRGPSGNRVELRTAQRAEHVSVALAEAIEELHAGGYPYRDQAVLCTGNDRLSSIGQDLERLGVPVLFLGSLFERPEVKDLIALLSLLVDRRAMGLLRISCWPEFRASLADAAETFDFLRRSNLEPGTWLHRVNELPNLSENGSRGLLSLATALGGFDHTAAPWTVLATVLLDRTRIAAELGVSTQLSERTRAIAIWQFLNFVRVQPRGRGLPITRLLDRVRRLVRLGDDRDLRQLPAAAQHLNAVRLMTVHGSKGLEFRGVHLPGMNASTLPRTPQIPPCLPPDGLVAGAEGSPAEAFRAGFSEEQECLFYVALSRARDRLILYAPTQTANGNNRPLSPYLDRLGGELDRRTVVPLRALPPAPGDSNVEMQVEGNLRFKASQMALYEKCPRRFFYTHILQVGGLRTSTAFMQLHDAVRSVVDVIVGSDTTLSDGDVGQHLEAELTKQGLADHGYLAEFRELASVMLRYFLNSRAGAVPEQTTALSLIIGGEQIIVRPDEILLRPDGVRAVRRISTGHQRKEEAEDVGAAALVLAVQQAFPGAVAELVYLSDEQAEPIALSVREISNRRKKLESFMAKIRAGEFPADVSPRTCPRCPAFFICGATPEGPLRKKFD